MPGSWTAGLTDRQSIYIDLTNNCITTTGYTTPEQSWLTANVTMSPQNICLIYTINTNEGTFSGASSASVVQTVTSGASGTPVQVLPKPSYTFSQWSDGSTANPRTDTNVT
ncbi:hypothetical protein KAZ93_01495 [Patescibacteria group bacterium]|nr:hypothetical protein [Patescibacteria group bacterium]